MKEFGKETSAYFTVSQGFGMNVFDCFDHGHRLEYWV